VDGDLYFDRQADRERQMTIDALKQRILGDHDGEGDDGPDATGESVEEGESKPPPDVVWQDKIYSCREIGS
jgi:hypothetical protein